MNIKDNAVVVDNRKWKCAAVCDDAVLGMSGDSMLRVSSTKRVEYIVTQNTRQDMFTGVHQPLRVRTNAGVAKVTVDNGEMYMLIDGIAVTQFAPTANVATITPRCRVVTTTEYTGACDLLSGKWAPMTQLITRTCLAVSDGKECVRLLTTNGHELILSEISLGVDHVHDIATWQFDAVDDAVIVNGYTVMVINSGNVYLCERGNNSLIYLDMNLYLC